jgi:hypothetical protein
LTRLAVDALILDDLQVLGVTGELVAEEHGSLAFDHHDITASLGTINRQFANLWHYIYAKLRLRLSKINGL